MKKILALCLVMVPLLASAQPMQTLFEKTHGTQTPPYEEIIRWWKELDKKSFLVKIFSMGPSDAGYPLHLVVLSADGDFNFESLHRKNRSILLINNGIHPGEPDGIDASMLLARDIVAGKMKLPSHIVLAIIPIYNIGGCLNRSPNYRVDQNGPEEFGFRGNSQNLDLNRDFIKCDSKEARSFAEIFHRCDPDILIDNHVSNGADYQHIMTLLSTQHNKLGGEMGQYLHEQMEPGIYTLMKKKGYDLVPYVDFEGNTPDAGMTGFFDGPRYSSGFATLWQTFAFMPETHMLKSYEQRVRATYALMQCFIAFAAENGKKIQRLREEARQALKNQKQFPLSWSLDRSHVDSVLFKGYEAGRKPSEVSGMPRLYYDRNKPFEKKIPYFNYYQEKTVIRIPKAYIIPKGWWKITELLRLNGVKMIPLSRDTVIRVEVYRIDNYKTSPRQYEMHHPNSDVTLSSSLQSVSFSKGDYFIPCNQAANRFLVEVLEPQGGDSYFAWNFFDAILGQKEGYSAYAFEDIAADYLKKHPEVRTLMDEKRSSDSSFARNGAAQLNFVFAHSPYYEPAHLRYPVYRLPD